jgi:hypothetical protein
MNIRLTLRDVAGRTMAHLANGRFAEGAHSIPWSSGASRIPVGIYFVDLQANGQRITKRLVVIE